VYIDQLFARFGAIYSHKWTRSFTSHEMWELAKGEWAHGLRGFSTDMILRGIEAAKFRLEWPPSIAEFRRLRLGIPDAETVAMRVSHGGGDQVSDTIMAMIGSWDCRRLPDRELKALAHKLYAEAVDHVTEATLSSIAAIGSSRKKAALRLLASDS